jgi:hypothetical protein
MDHVPSGSFSANSAWLQCAVLAHNLIRWTATLGQPRPVDDSLWPAPCESASLASQAVWSTGPASPLCEGRRVGRGRRGSPADSSGCAPYSLFLADSPSRLGAPPRDQRRQPQCTGVGLMVRVAAALGRPGRRLNDHLDQRSRLTRRAQKEIGGSRLKLP